MVERDLPKVDVAGSSPVIRSKYAVLMRGVFSIETNFNIQLRKRGS